MAIDQEVLTQHPDEYAALAYLLDASGFPVKRTFPTSEQERTIKQTSLDWLHGNGEG